MTMTPAPYQPHPSSGPYTPPPSGPGATTALAPITPRGETALARVEPQALATLDRHGFEPANADDCFRTCMWLVKSGFYPAANSPEKAFAIVAQGRELGLGMLASLNGIDIIEGRPALRAQLQLALIKGSSRCRYIKLIEDTAERCTWETLRTDDPTGKPERASFTRAEATEAGYLTASKDGKVRKQWRTQPQVMLSWRALSKLARRTYPDVLFGIQSTEEALDAIELERDVDGTWGASITVAGKTGSVALDGSSDVAPPPSSTERAKAAIAKAQAAHAAAGGPAHEELGAELIKMQRGLLDKLGPDRAKEAWYSTSGPGKFSRDDPTADLARCHARASELLRKLDCGDKINRARLDWREMTGEVLEPIARPEEHETAELEAMLDVEQNRIEQAMAGEEGSGSNG